MNSPDKVSFPPGGVCDEEEAVGENIYDADTVWGVQESGLDIQGDHPEIWITSDRLYIVGAGAEEAHYYGEPGVEHSMVTKAIMNLRMAMLEFPDSPLVIHLKSCGGCWTQGMALYNGIRAYPNDVFIVDYAQARSMSSLVFCAGDHRIIMPDGQFMFHTGLFSGEFTGRQLRNEYLEWEKNMTRMLDIYVLAMSTPGARYENETDEFKRDWLEHQMLEKEEAYFDAPEAVELGFADNIFESWTDIPAVKDEDEVDDDDE